MRIDLAAVLRGKPKRRSPPPLPPIACKYARNLPRRARPLQLPKPPPAIQPPHRRVSSKLRCVPASRGFLLRRPRILASPAAAPPPPALRWQATTPAWRGASARRACSWRRAATPWWSGAPCSCRAVAAGLCDAPTRAEARGSAAGRAACGRRRPRRRRAPRKVSSSWSAFQACRRAVACTTSTVLPRGRVQRSMGGEGVPVCAARRCAVLRRAAQAYSNDAPVCTRAAA